MAKSKRVTQVSELTDSQRLDLVVSFLRSTLDDSAKYPQLKLHEYHERNLQAALDYAIKEKD